MRRSSRSADDGRYVDVVEIERCERCGSVVALLNELSPEPRCVDCGYPPERCTCTGERYAGQP